jgi:hypothetical protein
VPHCGQGGQPAGERHVCQPNHDFGHDSNPQTVLNFELTTPLNYQVVMADAVTESAYGGIPYIPTTFIISRQNLIMKKFVGSQTLSTLEQQVVPLLYALTRLTASRIGDQLVLRWPTNVLTFTLESAGTADPVWSTWPTPPTVVNGSNSVFVSLTSSNRLFRLRMPY